MRPKYSAANIGQAISRKLYDDINKSSAPVKTGFPM